MNRFALILRYGLFCVFFTIGAGAVTLSILIDPELSTCFQNRQMLDRIGRDNDKIRDLTEQYQAQIDLIRSEPNVLTRLEHVTFGNTAGSQQPALPAASSRALKQTAQSVLAELKAAPPEPALPDWFGRCRKPNTRTALFAAGAGLILITFLFFGSPGTQKKPPERRFSTTLSPPDDDP